MQAIGCLNKPLQAQSSSPFLQHQAYMQREMVEFHLYEAIVTWYCTDIIHVCRAVIMCLFI